MKTSCEIFREDWSNRSADVVVVIDVLRAFTTARVLMERGVDRIRLSSDYNEVLELTQQGYLSFGESGGYPLDGLSSGNSPARARVIQIEQRPVVLLTTHGVPAALAASEAAPRAIATGLRGARFIADMLERASANAVEIWTSDPNGADDLAVAEYLRGLLTGNDASYDAAARGVRESPTAEKFIVQTEAAFPPEDLEIALDDSPDPFVMTINRVDQQVHLIKESIR